MPRGSDFKENRAGRQYSKMRILFWVAAGVAVFLCCRSLRSPHSIDSSVQRRKLLSSTEECGLPKWADYGVGIILGILLYIWALVGNVIICNEYYIHPLRIISTKFRRPTEEADKIFMSAPDLFVTVMILARTGDGYVSLGEIVGWADFNFLVIIGVALIVSRHEVFVGQPSFFCNVGFYFLAISVMFGILFDGKVYWWECLILVVLYLVYVLTYKQCIKAVEFLQSPTIRESRLTESQHRVLAETAARAETSETSDIKNDSVEDDENSDIEGGLIPLLEQSCRPASDDDYGSDVGKAAALSIERLVLAICAITKRFPSLKNFVELVLWLPAYIWKIAFKFTVLDCKKERWERWYWLTLVMSLLWIAVISCIMVESAYAAGCLVKMPDVVVSSIFLAVGGSLPDLKSSYADGKRGWTYPTISGAISSNVFDLSMSLGLGGLIVIPFSAARSDAGGKYILFDSGLFANWVFLYGSLGLLVLAAKVFRWRLFCHEGYFLLVLFVVRILYSISVWADHEDYLDSQLHETYEGYEHDYY